MLRLAWKGSMEVRSVVACEDGHSKNDRGEASVREQNLWPFGSVRAKNVE